MNDQQRYIEIVTRLRELYRALDEARRGGATVVRIDDVQALLARREREVA